ncbi:TIR domain-containing protein [Micromonospora chalcea]|uniref:TIR domain-containing protein n=1 Tax=Micromonospora chalcea TaxID=1874 RepID=UPI003815AFA7
MKIFISWSKPRSRQLAQILYSWLPEVIQQVEPWMSDEDIDKGQLWQPAVGAQLEALAQGILCVTPENVREPWLNFEAGALARSLNQSRVRPILFEIKKPEVSNPLAMFQATEALDRTDMFKLIVSLNGACSSPLDPARLERAFAKHWDEFVEQVARIQPPDEPATVARSAEEMLEEVLERIREIQRSTESNRPGRTPGSVLPRMRMADGTLFHRGMTVIHPEFGPGRVLGILPLGSGRPVHALLGVDFEDGERRFLSQGQFRLVDAGQTSLFPEETSSDQQSAPAV